MGWTHGEWIVAAVVLTIGLLQAWGGSWWVGLYLRGARVKHDMPDDRLDRAAIRRAQWGAFGITALIYVGMAWYFARAFGRDAARLFG